MGEVVIVRMVRNFGKSIRGLEWCVRDVCERQVLHLVQALGVGDTFARILVCRGIVLADEARKFISSGVNDHIVDPFLLRDMEIGVERVIRAIRNKEKIAVFADYDVDGATSAAILMRFLHVIGVEVEVYVPHRIREGYGPNVGAFQRLKALGVNVVITVDCGIVAFGPMRAAKQMGLDVIIVDHHMSLAELPDAVAVINPNRIDDDFPYKAIAAVAVTFFFVIALRARLRTSGWFAECSMEEPNLMSLVDLVALGTVCDVMPLRGINRAFVRYGLKYIANGGNSGISSLVKFSKIDARVDSSHLCYTIGPRINAGGRVGEGRLSAILLSTNDPLESDEIAERLEKLNNARRAMEMIMMEEAVAQVEQMDQEKNAVITVFQPQWHLGILGILASKLKEMYCKPVVVAAVGENNLIKGSIRSIYGIDIGSAILDAKSNNMLIDGGGHAMAGGFSVEVGKFDDFCKFLNERFCYLLSDGKILRDAKKLHIDAVVDMNALNDDLMIEIDRAAPFGYGNEAPRFLIPHVVLRHAMVVGGNHVVAFVGSDGVGKNSSYLADYGLDAVKTVKIVAFRSGGTAIGEFLLNNVGTVVDVVGTYRLSNRGRCRIEMILDDIAINE